MKRLVSLAFLAAVLAAPALARAQPGQAALSTVGGLGTFTFVWFPAAGSTWYYLWVNDGAGMTRHQAWYTAEQTKCAAGEGRCQLTVLLSSESQYGLGTWWIQTWNNSGFGPWSAPGNFYLRPSTAPIVLTADTNKYVGVLLDTDTVLVDVLGAPAAISIVGSKLHLLGSMKLYFTGEMCDGTAYGTAVFPDRVDFTGSDGGHWLRRGTPIGITYKSYRINQNNGSGACQFEAGLQIVQPMLYFSGLSQFAELTGLLKAR